MMFPSVSTDGARGDREVALEVKKLPKFYKKTAIVAFLEIKL